VSHGGLIPYVVDSETRLVAVATSDYATGQDITNPEIVRTFVDLGSKAQMVAATREFNLTQGKTTIKMLGTCSPVTNLDWAVVVQKPCAEAYRAVYEMQRTGRILAIMAIALSIAIASFFSPAHTNRWKC
jgi:hypothetical protein